MEELRRIRRNKLTNEIRETEAIVNRSKETITRIKRSDMGAEYVKNQVEKLEEAISDKNELLITLSNTMSDLNTGILDEEMEDEHKQTSIEYRKKYEESKKIKAHKKECKVIKEEKSKQYMKGIIAASRAHRQSERDINYSYRYYCKISDSLPEYIQKNLKDMPNNKGYIWRDVCFYGKKDAQKGSNVMFEKPKGKTLIIHEYTDTEYIRFHKEGKDKKKMVFKQKKRIIDTGPSLMDYLVVKKKKD